MTVNRIKLTLNKPAENAFMKGDKFDGLKVKTDDNSMELLPVVVGLPTDHPDYPGDVIPIDTRGDRGGVKAIVEGSGVEALLELFGAMNPAGPFFVLERQSGGWLRLIPHPMSTAPQKFTPHLRVWLNVAENSTAASDFNRKRAVAALKKPVEQLTLGDLRRLHEPLAAYEAVRRPGRPPREILAIKTRLDEYRKAISPYLSTTPPDHALFEQMHAMLGRVLGKDQQHYAEDEAPQPAPKAMTPKVEKAVKAKVEAPKVEAAAPKAQKAARAPAPAPETVQVEDRSFVSRDDSVSDEMVADAAARMGATASRTRMQQPSNRATQRLGGGRTRSVIVDRVRIGQRRRLGQPLHPHT